MCVTSADRLLCVQTAPKSEIALRKCQRDVRVSRVFAILEGEKI